MFGPGPSEYPGRAYIRVRVSVTLNFLGEEVKIRQRRKRRKSMASAVGSGAAMPFWRAAGMTYISYSNICANLVRNCLKEPYKSESISREKVHFAISKWENGNPQKPSNSLSLSIVGLFFNLFFIDPFGS